MSLIADALKTAQRQKQLRESGRPSGSPLLVPMRTAPTAFSWQRAVVMAVSGIVIVASVVVMVQRMRPKPSLVQLPPVPSPPSPLAGTPLLSSEQPKRSIVPFAIPSARRDFVRPMRDSAGAATARASASPPTVTSHIAENRPGAIVTAPPPLPPARSNSDSRAELQGEPSDPVPAPPRVDPPRPLLPSGRLRIAVEQPVTTDVARLFAEALTFHRAGYLAAARPLYERVLTIAPNDADALNNLGVLLSAQREFDRALDLLRRAASVAPNNAGTWNNIGAALREQGRGSDASAAFRHALSIDPNHLGAKVGLAQHYLATGAPAEARVLLEEVLSLNPGLAEARYTLGQTLELLGDRPGAVREFSAFMRYAPPRLSDHVERVRRHVDSLTTQQ